MIRGSYDAMFPLLSEAYPEVFPNQIFSWDKYVWGTELWNSYGMTLKLPNGEIKTGIVPVACLLNHSVSATCHFHAPSPITPICRIISQQIGKIGSNRLK